MLKLKLQTKRLKIKVKMKLFETSTSEETLPILNPDTIYRKLSLRQNV
jgi:hypothetical protein